MASPKIVISVAVAGDRQLMVSDDHEVSIKDITTTKCAYFTAPHWARFVGMIEEIDASVQQASYGKPTAYSTLEQRGMFRLMRSFQRLMFGAGICMPVKGIDWCRREQE